MTNWTRLATAVEARRSELMMSQAELAARAGISESTVRSIERARRVGYRLSTLRDLSTALGWTPTSISRILEGEEPEPVEPVEEPPPTDLHAELARLREEVAQLRAIVLGERAQQR